MITLIKGGWIVAWEQNRHRIIKNGEVAFEGNRIIYAGPKFEGNANKTIHRPEWVVCPGFINLHGHVGVDPMAPFVDVPRSDKFAPSLDFVKNTPLNMIPTLTPEEQQLSGEFCLVQMLRTGTTTVVDAHGYGAIWWLGNSPTDESLLAETVGRIGCRAYLALAFREARTYRDRHGVTSLYWDRDMGIAGLEQGLRFALTHRGAYEGRVQTLLTPHAVEKFTPDFLKRVLSEARDEGLPIQIHTSQSIDEVQNVMERHGHTPVGFLNSLGFLGPDIILGHCVFVDSHPETNMEKDQDLKLIADAGSSVAHAPLAFAQRDAAMLYSLPRYIDYGINIGIGCDIWPADIIMEMRLAWLLGKQANRSVDRPTCMEVFTAATVGSADALNRSDLGRLTKGALADIVCIDLSGYHFGPVLNPVRSLVSFGTGQDVDTIYVDGQKIVEAGCVLNTDEEKLKKAAPEILQKLHMAASQRDPAGRTADSISGL